MHIHIYIYTQMGVVFFFLAFLKLLGITSPSFLRLLFRSLLGRCGGAHGLLAGLSAAVPGCSHSAASIGANRLLRSCVLEAAVLAGGVLTSFACLGSVVLVFFSKHLVLFHVMAKVAPARALCPASLAITVPAGPLARVGAAAVHCVLFVFW